ncbi:G protein-regulated inducer of neurite outgrowth 3 [Rhineura floridana]|uniref:G protein-regulated inducer of neurite outgrowth 3 n=1 Tax=Rhineura floridana TaxID=261503 RepID=UPI002AC86EBD|nr:G protein-regulated inducer of neurite outgrowth 3 [Rhineura floridana]XP_061439013.1 G protein-regulated inducer of neurite outgrowth 3 [Rhineura floridana]
MGTVPDPLRSAKLSLVKASEEENGLKDLPSPKHQCKQASIDRNSNGFPFTGKMQPTGDRLLEVNCTAEADVPRGERHCGYDTSQPRMFSPGFFSPSPSKKGYLATLELGNDSEQEGSDRSSTKGQDPAEGHYSAPAAVKVPATQGVKETVQSDTGGQLHSAVDEASSPSRGGDRVMESKAHNSSPPSTYSDAQPAAPTTKEIVGERICPERTQVPASAKESEPVSGLGLRAQVSLDTELKGSENASFHPGAKAVPEMVPISSLESTPQPSCRDETMEEAGPELSKFKDTGTMTVQPDGRPADGEATGRTCQDAEVQAVASMESKSAATSPSIFAAFLRENMTSETTQKEEQLHIIYTGAGGKEQSEVVNDFTALVQTAPSSGIMPEVHIQAPAGAGTGLAAQTVKLQGSPVGTRVAAGSALSGNTTCPCPPASGSTRETSVKAAEAQRADVASNRGDAPQQLSDSSSLLKTTPINEITVNASTQPLAPQHSVNSETKLPPSSALPGINSKPQHPGSQQTSPSCHRVSEQGEAIGTVAGIHDSSHGEQLPIKTSRGFEMGPVSFHTDVKPKGEGESIPLNPKEQEMNNTAGVAAEPQAMRTPVVAKTGQDRFPKENKEVEVFGNQNLASESGSSRNSAPGLGTKNSKTRKGPKGNLSAIPAPAQPMPKLSQKKKEAKSAVEAKVHLKQSKRVQDVVWDEQGMTWEVYGASLDPEFLGIAIQNHLQRQIREHEKLIKVQSAQTRKSVSSDTSSSRKLKGRQHNVFQSMLQNFRRPNCCVRPAASSVLD